MAKLISSIYDNLEKNLVPFYPNVGYCQSTGSPPEWAIELDKRADDAMFLSRVLDISCEQVLRWFRGDATNPERHECEGAMKRQLANCEKNERDRLMAICRHYSLSIVGETICSQKTSSPSSEVKSDITPIKQVGTAKAEGQEVTHVTQGVQVEPNEVVRVALSNIGFLQRQQDVGRNQMITSEHKREIAIKLLEGHPGWYPEHYGKELGLNDSHLCRFRNEKEDVLISVKCLKSGKTNPCIGFYFKSHTKRDPDDFRNLGLPVGFKLNRDAISTNDTGWVEFCRADDCDEDRMYREIVVSADKREEWKDLFEALRKWGTENIGGESHYGQEKGWKPKWENAPMSQNVEEHSSTTCGVPVTFGSSNKLKNVTNEDLVDNVLAPEGDPFPEGCQAVVVTVERLLRMNLRIPEYQRPYKWTRRSVEELMQDIRDSVEIPDGPESMPLKYRLGTVILDASSTDGGFDVVDGQQRILTLLLINRVLNEIRKNKVSCPLLEDGVTMKVLSRSRVSRKNLHENYAVVKSCLARDYELRKKLVVAFNSTLEMVVVKVNELSEAFQLFDSQNTRGRALDPHDLLKAFHLRAMAQKAKAQGMVAEKAEEEMRSVVTEWEAQSEESLRSLFDNWLFRISNWSRKRRTHPFSAADIHEFKGVPFDSEYSFALRAKAAMPRGDDAASRRFQIGEDFEEGREFFRMVSHYLRMVEAAKSDALFKDRPEIKNVLKLADGKGFSHVENMFRCALMSYVDRFGEDALSDPRVVDKLCLWAFILRLDMNHVSEDSINKYAVIEGGADYTNTIPMFSVIKTARTPSDIAIQDVCGVSGSRYKRKQGVKGREQLQNALKKVEA